MPEKKRYVGLEHKERIIIDQQFWFTATIMGVNGFLISYSSNIVYTKFTLIWITFMNLYTLFLIIHRAASHADKIKIPTKILQKPQGERTPFDKAIETIYHFKACIKHIPFMIAEFSGSLFYSLLVITSYIAFVSICKFSF